MYSLQLSCGYLLDHELPHFGPCAMTGWASDSPTAVSCSPGVGLPGSSHLEVVVEDIVLWLTFPSESRDQW